MIGDKCDHPKCSDDAICGINSRFVCMVHLDWAFEPIETVKQMVSRLLTATPPTAEVK